MLRVTVDWFVLAGDTIEDAWRLLIVDFSFLSEVDASDPLVLYFFEWRLDLQDDC